MVLNVFVSPVVTGLLNFLYEPTNESKVPGWSKKIEVPGTSKLASFWEIFVMFFIFCNSYVGKF